jgi:BirA family biotin operon repressor/biotin-[acetyl-CoA-carboxylase] ligase
VYRTVLVDRPGHNVRMTVPRDWDLAADAARRIGHRVEFHPSIGSTNDRARELLASAGEQGVAVVGDLQTAGRGRRGREWSSPAGVNLMVSVALRPRLSAATAGLLALSPALAALDACAAATGQQLAVRWPNDVVTSDGLKVAGLLVETAIEDGELREAVIGIGINVNWRRHDMPAEIAARATSLADLAGRPLDRVALLRDLLERLDREIADLEAGASPVERLAAASALHGRPVTVDLGGDVLDGVVAGLAADGALLLDAAAGRVALTSGEVVSVRDRIGEPVAS